MVKIEELLEPGETVIKDSSATDERSTDSTLGRLYLTDSRLIFIPSRLATFGMGNLIKPFTIPLNTIREVKSGWWKVTITTDRKTWLGSVKYKFGGFRGRRADEEWADAIERARKEAGNL